MACIQSNASVMRNAMRCQLCDRALTERESVWRVTVGYWSQHNRKFGGTIGSICNDCLPEFGPDESWRWHEPRSCEHCQRPVVLVRRRKVPKHVVCGSDCRRALQLAAAKAKRARRRGTTTCLRCKEEFQPRRLDARYCSAACRQSAYRRRNRKRSARLFTL
jgi:hypothetical protein